MNKRGDRIHIPFLGEDKNTIEKVRLNGKSLYPKWKKTRYNKPRLIKDEEFGDFWTHPEIIIEL